MDKKQTLMIATGGAAATLVGLFLPWVTLSSELGEALKSLGQSASASGISTGDGKIVLVLAITGLVVAGAAFLGKSLPIGRKASMLVGFISLALAAAVCVIDFLDIGGPAVSVGIGLYLCLAGSIVGAATSFLAWRQIGAEAATATPAEASS